MRLLKYLRFSASFLRSAIPLLALSCAIVIFSVPLANCGGDYCFTGIFTPGGGVSVGSNGTCSLNTGTGTVTTQMTTTSMNASAGPMATNFLHLFVTVRGIEASTDAEARDDSPGWQELAPELSSEPKQIDLLGASELSRAAITAGAYRQVRLQLAPMNTAIGDAITRDGNAHAFMLKDGSSYIRLGPAQIAARLFRVLPGATTNLTIQFNRFASTIAPSNNSLLLTPEFAIDFEIN
jgi:hypothetical protein